MEQEIREALNKFNHMNRLWLDDHRERSQFREDVRDALGYMRGKVEAIDKSIQDIETDVVETKQRVTKLENWKWHMTGAAAAVGVLASTVKQKLGL